MKEVNGVWLCHCKLRHTWWIFGRSVDRVVFLPKWTLVNTPNSTRDATMCFKFPAGISPFLSFINMSHVYLWRQQCPNRKSITAMAELCKHQWMAAIQKSTGLFFFLINTAQAFDVSVIHNTTWVHTTLLQANAPSEGSLPPQSLIARLKLFGWHEHHSYKYNAGWLNRSRMHHE